MEGLTAEGQVAWTRPMAAAHEISTDPSALFRVGLDGSSWTADLLSSSRSLGPPVGTLIASDGAVLSPFVEEYGSSGALSGALVAAGIGFGQLGDLALGPGGTVVVLGWDEASLGRGVDQVFVQWLGR